MPYECKNTENSQNSAALLDVRGLSVSFNTRQGSIKAVDGISFSIPEGSVTALVGESGCGKSVTARSIMRLLSRENAAVSAETISLVRRDGSVTDLMKSTEKELCRIRGNEISMIFQEPMSALNPVLSIGRQIEDVLKVHTQLDKSKRRKRVLELISGVGIADPMHFSTLYPHEISGGMRQRAVIAMAVAMRPRLIIADEPTTALDVTIQAQILDLLSRLQKETGSSVLLITHDLEVVREIADRVLVMYAGRIVESGSKAEVFSSPLHPYTQALLKARPGFSATADLHVLKGSVPLMTALPSGCSFSPRCPRAFGKCREDAPQPLRGGYIHKAACHLCPEEVH